MLRLRNVYAFLPADDYGWIFQVPLSEINDNQSISEEDQNPLKGNVWTGK